MEFLRRPSFVSFCLLTLLPAAPIAAQPKIDAAEARKIEAQIAERQAHVGGDFNPAYYLQLAGDSAARLEVEPPSFDFDPEGRRLKLADGSPADFEAYRIEVAGSLAFSQVYTYLNDLWAFRSSGVKLEELRMGVLPGNQVEFRARYSAVHATAPVVPFPSKPTAEHVERRRLTLALLDQLAADDQSRGLVDSLGFLAEKLEPVAIGFSAVELKDGKGRIEGAALGPTAVAAFEAALEESGLVAAKVDYRAPARVCRPFTASFAPGGRAPEDSYMYFGYNGLFDTAIASLCAPPAAAKEIKLAGKAGAAGHEFELRDVALLDALAILADLTEEGFVASPGLPDVRLSFAVRGASSQELLAALAAAGVTVAPGNPHWVLPAGAKAPAAPPAAEGKGERVFFTQYEGTLKDLACRVGQDTGKEIWTAAPLDAEAIVFAGLPWDQTLAAALAPHGLVAVEAESRVVIGPGPADALAAREDLADLCSQEYTGEPAPSGSRLADMEFSEGSLKLEDFELAGFGKRNGEFFGIAFFPNRKRPRIVTTSAWLGDGSVTVGKDGIQLEREDGSKGHLKWPPAGD
jgi:hypothetical protein